MKIALFLTLFFTFSCRAENLLIINNNTNNSVDLQVNYENKSFMVTVSANSFTKLNYPERYNDLIRLTIENNRYGIIPKNKTVITLDNNNLQKIKSDSKDDSTFNAIKHQCRSMNMEVSNIRRKMQDTSITKSDSLNLLKIGTDLCIQRDSFEINAFLTTKSDLASLYFLNNCMGDKYYDKKTLELLYKKIDNNKSLDLVYRKKLKQIFKSLSLENYKELDKISKKDAHLLGLKNNKQNNIFIFAVHGCMSITSLLDSTIQEIKKSTKLTNSNIVIVATPDDTEIIDFCKEENVAFKLEKNLSESELSYKLWLRSAPSSLIIKDGVIVKNFATTNDLRRYANNK